MQYTVQIHNGKFPSTNKTVEASSALEAAKTVTEKCSVAVILGKPGPLTMPVWFSISSEGIFLMEPGKEKFSMVRTGNPL